MKRKDGIRIKDADPMYQVAAYIMNKRVDSMNMITLDIPLDPMVNYVRDKMKEEGVRLSRLAVLIAALMEPRPTCLALTPPVVAVAPDARCEVWYMTSLKLMD